MKLLLVSVSTALLAACSSTPTGKPDLGGPPSNVRGYPSETPEDIVICSARYPIDHARELQMDLLRELNVLPVHLKVTLHGEGAEVAQYLLSQERWDPRLILQDGTVLRAADPADLVDNEERAATIRSKAFKPGFLNETREGYLYFALSPKSEFTVNGDTARHQLDGTSRGISLTESLLVFRITKEEGVLEDFYVGIRP